MERREIDEELFPLGLPDRRRPVRGPHSPAGRVDLVVAVVLFVLSVPVLGACWFGVLLSMFAFDACGGGGCNERAGSAALIGFPIAAGLSTVLLAVVAARRRQRSRRAWMLGVAAVVVIVALFFLAANVVLLAARPT